jgi:hypothetical protein
MRSQKILNWKAARIEDYSALNTYMNAMFMSWFINGFEVE